MFIFVLTYQKPIQDVEKYLEAHRNYLDKNYNDGHFIASGRQEPRTGGLIICKAESKDKAIEIMQSDPFYINEIAKYDIIEFIPTKFIDGFDKFL